ncbi:MAG: 30S ribosome-binding factor RbfA [Firmicutes bacterium]|nr:30S ribosome-binding factor RbfA [Bacillota bacterium]
MSVRIHRINSEMQKSLSYILHHKMRNPEASGLTVTKVDCAKDLKTAKVYVSVFGGEKAAALKAVSASAGFIRRELAAQLRDLRTVPELKFVLDDAADYGVRIDSLLDSLKKDREG